MSFPENVSRRALEAAIEALREHYKNSAMARDITAEERESLVNRYHALTSLEAELQQELTKHG